MAISQEKLLKLSQLQLEAQRVKQELDKKQDALVFGTAYNAETNKAATMQDVADAVSGLSGAMHFKGTSTQDPTHEATAGTQDGPAGIDGYTTPAAGDVVTFGKKEYLYDGTKWREYGDEGDYAVKGSIKNADIAADAAIEQSKVANLTTDLGGKASKVTGATSGNLAALGADGDLADSGKKPSDFVAAEAGKRLMTDAEGTKLEGVKDGANKVEPSETLGSVKIDGTDTAIFAVAADSDVTTMLNTVFGTPA